MGYTYILYACVGYTSCMHVLDIHLVCMCGIYTRVLTSMASSFQFVSLFCVCVHCVAVGDASRWVD